MVPNLRLQPPVAEQQRPSRTTRHANIAHRLQEAWPQATIHNHVLGVSHTGLLPGNFNTDLQALGIPSSRINKLVRALACLSEECEVKEGKGPARGDARQNRADDRQHTW
jgi:hypothetical protein